MYRVQWCGCGRELAKYEQGLRFNSHHYKERKEGRGKQGKKEERDPILLSPVSLSLCPSQENCILWR